MSDTTREEWDVVEALIGCAFAVDENRRAQLIQDLPDQIKSGIERFPETRSDLRSIVLACARYQDGLRALREAVEFREQGSDAMALVSQRIDALDRKRRPKTDDSRPPVPAGGASAAQLALVIGISRYLYGHEPGQTPADREFAHLGFAADDANDLAALLKERGYVGPPPLINERASRRGIMQALDELRKECYRADNPLVLIFFSGHGARDGDGRDYLIPYDGERDSLFATALWSKTLDSALRELKTNRLVVFLDACHAGGVGAEGVKGELRSCDPRSLLTLEEGRYVVASCLANQESREWRPGDGTRGYGIFSHHLLQLLRCEREDDSDREEVDVFGLYTTLKRRVMATAKELWKDVAQEPWTNVEKPTDIVLATNQSRRQARVRIEKTLIDAIDHELIEREYEESELLRTALLRYVERGVRLLPERFYRYFRQSAAKYKGAPQQAELLQDICDTLIQYYSGGDTSLASPDVPPRAITLERPQPITPAPSTLAPITTLRTAERDSFTAGIAPAGEPAGERRVAAAARSSTVPSAGRRRFSRNDAGYVMQPIWLPAYHGVIGKLTELLERPDGVSKEEITTFLFEDAQPPNDDTWQDRRGQIAERFDERWERATPTIAQSAVDVRTGFL